jgi:Tol biopolymer transport system component
MDNPSSPIIEDSDKQRSNVVKWLLGIGLTGLVVLICAGVVGYLVFLQIRDNLETTEFTGPIFEVEPVRNHIAYIGNDQNVWLVKPDGQEQRHLTTDGRGYRFPTWAPDSRRLAFIGPDANDNTALYTSPVAESKSEPTILFDDDKSAPFYLYWAPDSQSITFLTQESSGLSMRQASPGNPTNQRVLEEGAPFYWVWSPTGDKLLMHVGGSRDVSDEAHISLLDNKQDAERVELSLDPGGFQAPVWSKDGKSFFYIASEDDQPTAIYKTNAETLAPTRVTNAGNFAYIVLSPDDKWLAYLQIERGDRPPFGTAYIVDTAGNEPQQLTDRSVGSMYWSPDGSKLALLTIAQSDDGSSAKAAGLASPLRQELALRWWIYEVATEKLEPLISFTPTTDFLQTIPYFDQYHLSLTFWSPDSRYFVITKEKSVGRGGTVWVVDTTEVEEPVQVGEGTMAVWSWQ